MCQGRDLPQSLPRDRGGLGYRAAPLLSREEGFSDSQYHLRKSTKTKASIRGVGPKNKKQIGKTKRAHGVITMLLFSGPSRPGTGMFSRPCAGHGTARSLNVPNIPKYDIGRPDALTHATAVRSSPPVVSENLLAGVYAFERHHGSLALRRELAKRGVIQGRVAAVVDVPAGRREVVNKRQEGGKKGKRRRQYVLGLGVQLPYSLNRSRLHGTQYWSAVLLLPLILRGMYP